MSEIQPSSRPLFRCLISFILLPLAAYFLAFCVLTFPLILKFSSHYFCDDGDGLIHIWNLWWVNKAVTELHQTPWHTHYLHYPYGVTLLPHNLTPWNGFMAIPLRRVLTLRQTHNFIVVFSFVVGGWTAFLFAYQTTRHSWGSFIAGCVFTFSNYHFTHAQGHLNLVALEWIPLFLLLWRKLTVKPNAWVALASALTLGAVELCDYYYLFYCVLAGILMLGWRIAEEKSVRFLGDRRFVFSLGLFSILAFLVAGPPVVALLRINAHDPLLGEHSAEDYGTDLLALFIPGGHWRFAQWTKLYWSSIAGNVHENSVHVGISLLILLGYVWGNRRRLGVCGAGPWVFMFIVFWVLSLGPKLHVWGGTFPKIPMPYSWLTLLIPPLKISGMPVRMMVMADLALAMLAGIGFKVLLQGTKRDRWLAAILLPLIAFEYLPSPIPATRIEVPDYVTFLRDLPEGAVIDLTTPARLLPYYQTIHEKPIALGYVSRIPSSLDEKEEVFWDMVNQKNYRRLRDEGHFRYLVVSSYEYPTRANSWIVPLFHDPDLGIELFDLAGN